MKIAGMQLGMHWRLDDWPDEVHVSHELTPNVSRSYVDAWRTRELEALIVDMHQAMPTEYAQAFVLRMRALGVNRENQGLL